MDSCIISFNLNFIMQLKQFYDIATKVSGRKKCYYFWWSTWLVPGGPYSHDHRPHSRQVTGVRCTGGLLLLLLRVFTRVCRVAQPSGQWELHNGEFFKFFDSSCYFGACFAISLWFSTNISYFLQLWCCLCGWLGRQLVHALGFLFLFGMLCMLDFCRHFCSYFFANHFFIKLNLLRVINTEISHACCSLCW